jgi:MFS family permease
VTSRSGGHRHPRLRPNHSPFLTALAYALTYLPPIAGGPLLSGLADPFPRRRVMIVCDLFRVGTVGLIAIPGLPFAALCILLFCTVLTGVPFSSARAGPRCGPCRRTAAVPLGMVIGAVVIRADQDDGLARRPVLRPADRHQGPRVRRRPVRPVRRSGPRHTGRRRGGAAG